MNNIVLIIFVRKQEKQKKSKWFKLIFKTVQTERRRLKCYKGIHFGDNTNSSAENKKKGTAKIV